MLDPISQRLPSQLRSPWAEWHKNDAAGQWAAVPGMPTRPLNTPHVAPDILHQMDPYAGVSLTRKKNCSGTSFPKKAREHSMCSTMVGGGWRLAVGGGWQLAVGNWRLVAVGGGWWRLVVGDCWLVAVGSGWQLAVGRRWRLAAVGGWWLVAGGWWLVVGGS